MVQNGETIEQKKYTKHEIIHRGRKTYALKLRPGAKLVSARYGRHLGFHVAAILKSKMAAIPGRYQIGTWSHFLEYIFSTSLPNFMLGVYFARF